MAAIARISVYTMSAQMTLSEMIGPHTTPQEFAAVWKRYPCPLASGGFNWGWNVLCTAASRGNARLIEYMVQKSSPKLLEEVSAVGETPLFCAVCCKQYDIAKKLLELGANVNLGKGDWGAFQGRAILQVNAFSKSPLWAAIELTQDIATIKLLLKYKAVAQPGLSEKGEIVLEYVQREMEKERKYLETVLRQGVALARMPSSLISLIAEYVDGEEVSRPFRGEHTCTSL